MDLSRHNRSCRDRSPETRIGAPNPTRQRATGDIKSNSNGMGFKMTQPSVTREQVLEASKGMLQKQVYAVSSTPTNGIGPVLEHLEAHLKHQVAIEKSGVLIAAGPQWTDDENFWEGDGLFVIRAESMAEASAIAASDPMHMAGARTFTVRPWLINEGSLVLRLSFSSGQMTLE